MKCSKASKAKLFALVDAGLAHVGRERIEAHKAKGLGNDKAKRFRWDLLNACRIDMAFLYGEGLNDDHIDTLLKAYVAERGY